MASSQPAADGSPNPNPSPNTSNIASPSIPPPRKGPAKILCCANTQEHKNKVENDEDTQIILDEFKEQVGGFAPMRRADFSRPIPWSSYIHIFAVVSNGSRGTKKFKGMNLYGYAEHRKRGKELVQIPEKSMLEIVGAQKAKTMEKACLIRRPGGLELFCKKHLDTIYTVYLVCWQKSQKAQKAEAEKAQKAAEEIPAPALPEFLDFDVDVPDYFAEPETRNGPYPSPRDYFAAPEDEDEPLMFTEPSSDIDGSAMPPEIDQSTWNYREYPHPLLDPNYDKSKHIFQELRPDLKATLDKLVKEASPLNITNDRLPPELDPQNPGFLSTAEKSTTHSEIFSPGSSSLKSTQWVPSNPGAGSSLLPPQPSTQGNLLPNILPSKSNRSSAPGAGPSILPSKSGRPSAPSAAPSIPPSKSGTSSTQRKPPPNPRPSGFPSTTGAGPSSLTSQSSMGSRFDTIGKPSAVLIRVNPLPSSPTSKAGMASTQGQPSSSMLPATSHVLPTTYAGPSSLTSKSGMASTHEKPSPSPLPSALQPGVSSTKGKPPPNPFAVRSNPTSTPGRGPLASQRSMTSPKGGGDSEEPEVKMRSCTRHKRKVAETDFDSNQPFSLSHWALNLYRIMVLICHS
jgi:hypothetical protein